MRIKIAVALQIKFLISISKRRVSVSIFQQMSLALVMTWRSRLKLGSLIVMNARCHTDPACAYETKRNVRAGFDSAFSETKIEALRQRIQVDRVHAQACQKSGVTRAVAVCG